MKRFSLFLVLATLLFCACDSDTVKVRGEVEGLNGTVKLLAEMRTNRIKLVQTFAQ